MKPNIELNITLSDGWEDAMVGNICHVLDCAPEELSNFRPIDEGLTNTSICFDFDGGSYVYRHPGAGTDAIISRESETFSQQVAKRLGIDDTFIYEDAATGWKLSRYIEGCVPFDYHDERHVSSAMEIARRLHGSGETSPWSFDVYQKAREIVDLIEDPPYSDFGDLASMAAALYDGVRSDDVAPVLCHNDFYAPNFLVHEGGIDLIDWEYSAMSDYASDLGTFICCSDYGVDEAEKVFAEYFQRTPTFAEKRHCMAYVGLSAYYWFVWALYKDATGDPVGEWLDLWYGMTKTFGYKAEAMY